MNLTFRVVARHGLLLAALSLGRTPTAAAGEASAAAQANLAPVPGFEEGGDPWYNHYLALGHVALDSENPFAGKRSLRISAIPEDPKKAAWNTCQQGKQSEWSVAVEEGRQYRLAVRARSSLVGDAGKFGLRQVDADRKTVRFDWQSIPAVAAWTALELTVTPAATAKHLQIYFMAGPKATAGSVWFDDVRLEAVAPPEPTAEVEPVVLENTRVAFRFDPARGYGLVGVTDKAVGRELLDAKRAGGDAASLWRLELIDADKIKTARDNRAPARASHAFAAVPGGKKLTVTWELAAPAATAVMETTLPDGGGVAEWRLAVEAKGGPSVWAATFPVVAGLTKLGDDCLAVPMNAGKAVLDPTRRMPETLRYDYPALLTTQYVAYWGSERAAAVQPERRFGEKDDYRAFGWTRGAFPDETGLYLACHDPAGFHKTFEARRSAGSALSLAFTHYPALESWPPKPKTGPSRFAPPYPVMLGVYDGTAEKAAERYRGWALKQRWAARGPLAKRADEPGLDRVRDVGFWAKVYHDPAKAVPETARYARYLQVPVDTHYPAYYVTNFDVNNPEYLPADPYFRQGVRDLHGAGIGVTPYVCGSLWDVDAQSWFTENARRYAAENPDGGFYSWRLGPGLVSLNAWINPAAAGWRAKVREFCGKLAGGYGISSFYIDVLPMGGFLCYDSALNPPHGGNYWVEGNRRLLEELRRSLEAYRPDTFFTAEGANENYIDLIENGLLLDLTRYGWPLRNGVDNLPLYNMTYHDYTLSYGSDILIDQAPDRFAWELALSTLWGQQPTSSGSPLPDPEKFPANAALLRDVVRMRHRVGRRYLGEGAWLACAQVPTREAAGAAPVAVVAPRHDVAVKMLNGNTVTWEGPAVPASAWRAADGSVGVALVNIADRDVPVTIVVDNAIAGPARQLWPSAYTAGGGAVLEVAVKARSSMLWAFGGAGDPEPLPLSPQPDWELIEAANGLFPTGSDAEGVLRASEDVAVRHEFGPGSCRYAPASDHGDEWRRIANPVQWDNRPQWLGAPRRPADKPFFLLKRQSYAVKADPAATGAMTVRAAGPDSFSFRAAANGGGLSLAARGAPRAVVVGGNGIRSRYAPGAETVRLEAGSWRVAAVDFPALAKRLAAAGYADEATQVGGLDAALAVDPARAAAGFSVAVWNRMAAFGQAGGPDFPEAEARRAALLALANAADALTFAVFGDEAPSAMENDWLAPFLPVAVMAPAGDGATLAGLDRRLGKVVVERSGAAAWRLESRDPAFTELALPFLLRVDRDHDGVKASSGRIFWMAGDWPMQVRRGARDIAATAGTTVELPLLAHNLGPTPLSVKAEVKGWRVENPDVLSFALPPFEPGKTVGIKALVPADTPAGVREVEVVTRYTDDPATEMAARFMVNVANP